jgi:transposase
MKRNHFCEPAREGTRPAAFRRGADSLAAMMQSVLRLDPFCGTVFMFRVKRADWVKRLVCHGTG